MIAVPPEPSQEAVAGDPDLELDLDLPLPATLPVGKASAVLCIGSCFHRSAAIRSLRISADGAQHRPTAAAMPRLDRFTVLHPALPRAEWTSAHRDPDSALDPELLSYRSGFWATIPVGPSDEPGEIELAVTARLANGAEATRPLGAIAVVPPADASVEAPAPGDEALIAVCMATFNPDSRLFQAQIESLRAQTDTNWICVIGDDGSATERFAEVEGAVAGDERFVLTRAPRRLGFYRNFERILGMVPAEAELVALCDHDDRWYPEKLATLRAAIGDAELAYSDLRLVDADGRVRANTLWDGRRRNHDNLASLVISNTVVGAACLFRRRAIERALPFPEGPGWNFHDHWLAMVALAAGEIAYVDRPLYDYVQHPRAVLGRVASEPDAGPSAGGSRLRAWLERRRGVLNRWRAAYFTVYLQRGLQAQVLLARFGVDLAPQKRRALRWLIAADRSPFAFAWLAARPVRSLLGRNETLRLEGALARGIAWRHLTGLRAGRRPRAGLDASLPSFDSRALGPTRRRWLADRR